MRNRHTYLEFQNKLKDFEVVNSALINTYFPDFDSKRLNEWQKKGYIRKLIKSWYLFSDVNITELSLFRWSNLLRKPSYISLESAFTYYGFIPEQSFEIKAVTSLKTIHYNILGKTFTYNTLSPTLLFGFKTILYNQKPICMARLEKAILDYLYLHTGILDQHDFEALRWNRNQSIDWELLESYLSVFHSKRVEKNINQFKKYMQ